MLSAKKYDQKNPYQQCQYNPYQLNQTVLHASDGSMTTIIDEKDIQRTSSWQSQFDNTIQNGPTYRFPPQQVWAIDKLKNINI